MRIILILAEQMIYEMKMIYEIGPTVIIDDCDLRNWDIS